MPFRKNKLLPKPSYVKIRKYCTNRWLKERGGRWGSKQENAPLGFSSLFQASTTVVGNWRDVLWIGGA